MNAEHDLLDLSGKRALVTGGSRGIGACICAELARCGAHVCVGYNRDAAGAARTVDGIKTRGGSATMLQANLVRPDEIRVMFDSVLANGPLDIFVHNAAIGSFKPMLGVRVNQWDLSMAVGARALLVGAQRAADEMPRGGRIVTVSSLGSGRVVPSYGAIGVSKAALEALTRYLAAELAPRGITVNAVSAGPIDAPALRAHPDGDAMMARAVERTPAGRMGLPIDVARVVVFLCSPLADWIVGQTIIADGGLSLTI